MSFIEILAIIALVANIGLFDKTRYDVKPVYNYSSLGLWISVAGGIASWAVVISALLD